MHAAGRGDHHVRPQTTQLEDGIGAGGERLYPTQPRGTGQQFLIKLKMMPNNDLCAPEVL